MYIAFWRWRSVVTREKYEDILEFRIESTTQVMLKNQSEFFFLHSPFYDLNMRYVIRTKTYLTRQIFPRQVKLNKAKPKTWQSQENNKPNDWMHWATFPRNFRLPHNE